MRKLDAKLNGKRITIDENDIPLIVNSLKIPKTVKSLALEGITFPMTIKEGGKVIFACRQIPDSRKESLASRAKAVWARMAENCQS